MPLTQKNIIQEDISKCLQELLQNEHYNDGVPEGHLVNYIQKEKRHSAAAIRKNLGQMKNSDKVINYSKRIENKNYKLYTLESHVYPETLDCIIDYNYVEMRSQFTYVVPNKPRWFQYSDDEKPIIDAKILFRLPNEKEFQELTIEKEPLEKGQILRLWFSLEPATYIFKPIIKYHVAHTIPITITKLSDRINLYFPNTNRPSRLDTRLVNGNKISPPLNLMAHTQTSI
jgi:hypothetical protein